MSDIDCFSSARVEMSKTNYSKVEQESMLVDLEIFNKLRNK